MKTGNYAAAFVGSCLASALVASQAASGFTITIQTPPPTSYTRAFAYDGTNLDDDYYYPSVLPDSGSHTASMGGSIATNEYDLSNAGFEITLDHTRVAALHSQGYTIAPIFFRSDEDVDYTLEGSYTAVDPSGRRIYLDVELSDTTAGETLFQNNQQSLGTVNESFVLGETGGDDSNFLTGSLSGTLTGGHLHKFEVAAAIISQPTAATAAATAGGSVTLTFSPEPTECDDGLDNDGDDLIDLNDPDCTGPTDPLEAPDADDDGVADDGDNCLDVPNGPVAGACYVGGVQLDGNSDGYGNPCDMDFNADGLHTGADVGPFITAIGASDPRADINCDGLTTGADVGPGIAVLGATSSPGPSGLSCAGTVPCP